MFTYKSRLINPVKWKIVAQLSSKLSLTNAYISNSRKCRIIAQH